MMQADHPSSQLPEKCAADELSVKLSEDLGSKLKVEDAGDEGERQNMEKKSVGNDVEADKEGGEEGEEEEEEEEFSFACVQSEGSPITAEEAFCNGLIRPVYPVYHIFDQNLLFGYEFEYHQDDYVLVPDAQSLPLPPPVKKVFVEDDHHDGGGGGGGGDGDGEDDDSASDSVEPQGPFCTWSGKTVAEASPDSCRKSNSTGFSRLWRFRDLLLRSNSDGKDAFVFINSDSAGSSSSGKQKEKEKEKEKKKAKETKKSASAHERLYVRNRASREEAKRRSYLPYKQVGFFTDVNGLSKNIHPF